MRPSAMNREPALVTVTPGIEECADFEDERRAY